MERKDHLLAIRCLIAEMPLNTAAKKRIGQDRVYDGWQAASYPVSDSCSYRLPVGGVREGAENKS